MPEEIAGFSGDASGGGGGGTPTPTSGNIAMALGFITEFNANVAIFNSIARLILENTMASIEMESRVFSNTLAIENTRRDVRALASIVSRSSNQDSPSNSEGYSADDPDYVGPI